MGDKQEDDVNRNVKEDVPQYRFLLIGKSGTGKSSTGNTLLGYEKNDTNAFKTGSGFEPTTLSAERKEITRHTVKRKAKITIVDTPDIVNLKALHTVAEWTQLICPLGEPFTVLLTIRFDNRYTQEDYDTYQTTKQCLGNLMSNNLIIVFTHFDQENGDLKGLINCNQELNEVFQDAKESFVKFDNSDRNMTKDDDIDVLLDLTDAKQTIGNEHSDQTSEESRTADSRLQSSYREYGFLIIGSPGAGKSSTGNTILGYQKSESKAFKTKCDLHSTTDVATSKREERCYGNNMRAIFTVVDTPNLEGEVVATLKEKMVELVGNEEIFTVIHVICCDRNYTPVDKKTYLALKELLSDRLKNRIIIGFTFFDKMDSENDIRDILLQPSAELSEALSDAQNRYVIFNNKANDEDKRNQVEALVDAVNFLERNMKMKIGLLRGTEDGIISVQERIKQYLKSNGIHAMIDLVPVSKPSSEISRHHLFLYVIQENNLKEGVSDLHLLHKLSEERFQEVRRRCIIVIALERPRNDDELLRAIEANNNLNRLVQMLDNRYVQIVYTHVGEESRKRDHNGEVSIPHDGHQEVVFKMIQSLVQQNCFNQCSFPEIARILDHEVHNNLQLSNNSSHSQCKDGKEKTTCRNC